MNTTLTLAKREYWENRGSFFKAPAVFGGFILLMAICYLILLCTHVAHYSIQGHIDATGNIPPALTADVFYGMSLPFMIVLWLVAFNYFLKCLYEDRQDRSLLFWQSMPISDWETILSKAIAGTIIISICTWACIVVTEFIFLIIITIAAGAMGLGNIGHLWNPATLIVAWLHILGALFLQALWLFPLFGWCMLCSAYAKKSPFLTAIIPFICVVIIETVFFHMSYIGGYVASRIHLAFSAWDKLIVPIDSNSVSHSLTTHKGFLNHFLFTHNYGFISLYWSLAIGLVFMAIAGYLRYSSYRSDG
jgi:ABC-2 type transport system permease protein